MTTRGGDAPWAREVPAGVTEVETDDDELLVVDAWPREVFAPHVHAEFNWLVPMRSGRLVIEVEGREHTIDANHWMCVFPWTRHAVRHVSDDTEVASLFVPSGVMHEAWSGLSSPPAIGARCIIGGAGTVAQGLALAWAELRFSGRRADEVDLALGRYLSGWLWRAYRAELDEAETWRLRLRLRLGDDGAALHELLERRLSDTPFPWDEVASQLGWSRRKLQRRLGEGLGVSPREVLTGVRLERSRELLKDEGRPISDVALACGFASQSHFATAFRFEYGVPPSHLRRRSRR
ncbi:MAG: helix-turn-helix transcriptional regulator [Myxococcaceae bacterium]|jgi:AraC-like DNA-binding protein|nr:helix-turn-helix transcriptional regulator [Myxococcaceae bacterium]MCA3012008.1 helix-turn-helix transcriptional regulator [Myxococcaceae bacterium]